MRRKIIIRIINTARINNNNNTLDCQKILPPPAQNKLSRFPLFLTIHVANRTIFLSLLFQIPTILVSFLNGVADSHNLLLLKNL